MRGCAICEFGSSDFVGVMAIERGEEERVLLSRETECAFEPRVFKKALRHFGVYSVLAHGLFQNPGF